VTSSKGWCELQAQIKSGAARKPFLLRYCFPETMREFLSVENGDPFLAALLLPAMKVGETLEIPAPVSERLLGSIPRIQSIYESWETTLRNVQVKAPVRQIQRWSTPKPSHRGLFFSCGVDSYYSLFKNLESHPRGEETITDLIVLRGFDLPFAGRDSTVFRTILSNARTVSRELRKNVLPVATNLRDFGVEFVRWDRLYHGAAMASIGLTLVNFFDRIYIASTFSHEQLHPWGSHPALDPLWSTERLSFSHDACGTRRTDKIRFIVQFPIVMDTLRVCTLRPFSGDVYNCGICEKCLRTTVGLHIAGALRKCRTLPNSIDLRLLRTIPVQEELRVFIEELMVDLGSSEEDVAIRSALEEALSLSTRSRPGREFFATPYRSLLLPIISRAPPLLRGWVRLWRALSRSPPSSIFDLFRFRRKRVSLPKAHRESAMHHASSAC
jgi:hypothetical protein